jgi:hypothetical protein
VFSQELRYNTSQIIIVGVVLTDSPSSPPLVGKTIESFRCRYLIKADGTIVDILDRMWEDVPFCDGLYRLGLARVDIDQKGPLTLYMYDSDIDKPIYMQFLVIGQNEYDSKYGNNNVVLKVETEPQST